MVQLTTSTLAILAVAGVNACTGPGANEATIDLITSFEGWEPNIYDDPSGNPTVGYGHLCSDSSCSDVPYSIPLSEADGRSLLASDLAVSIQATTIKGKVVTHANCFTSLHRTASPPTRLSV